jgi:peptidoglycan-N-acetylglucosamine deacetylase
MRLYRLKKKDVEHVKRWLVYGMIFILSFILVQNEWTSTYIETLKNKAIHVSKQETPLYQQIKERAPNYEADPEDAVFDRVWKLIPGYNGVKVDIEASYKKMKKKNEFNEQLLVYHQVPPKVHLDDLQPAPIYKGNPNKPMVSFIVNVAWGNEQIPKMLEIFKKHDVLATFFLEGRWVKNNPELAKTIAANGHELGNHSYSHPDMSRLPSVKIREELEKTNELIKGITGTKVKWFAPPSGSFREETILIAHEMKMKTIMWSVDTVDWKKPPPSVIIERVTSKIHPGAIVLMHPTQSTVDALDALLHAMKTKNFKVGTISELLSEKRIMNRQEASVQ